MHADRSLKPKALREYESLFTEKSTTVAWCNRQHKHVAEQRLLSIAEYNIQAATRLVNFVADMPAQLHQVRLGSGQIPMATEPSWRYLWQDASNRAWLESGWRTVGDLARQHDVRLSFHPGQFCCVVSDRPDVVDRSLDELEYHADIMRWMGYGQVFQDFKCNVHLSGRAGPDAFPAAYARMSPELRNTLTMENDEFGAGLDQVLKVSDLVPIVLDIHHHLIHDQEYIQPHDVRVSRVLDSWRGVRPVMHYSQSPRDLMPHHPVDVLPSMPALIASGIPRTKLRAHSDYLWNQASNSWALSFWDRFDIQVEAKAKNLATDQLWRHYLDQSCQENVRQCVSAQ